MNKEDKYLYWVDIAEYDMVSAEALMNTGRYAYVAFMCQQSLEKLAKGLYKLFDRLAAYYLQGRYPSFKEKISQLINKEQAIKLLNESKEVFIWMKSLKK